MANRRDPGGPDDMAYAAVRMGEAAERMAEELAKGEAMRVVYGESRGEGAPVADDVRPAPWPAPGGVLSFSHGGSRAGALPWRVRVSHGGSLLATEPGGGHGVREEVRDPFCRRHRPREHRGEAAGAPSALRQAPPPPGGSRALPTPLPRPPKAPTRPQSPRSGGAGGGGCSWDPRPCGY